MKWFESIIDPMSDDISHQNTILFSGRRWLRGRTLNDILNQRYLNQDGYAMIYLAEYGQGNLFMMIDLKKARQYEKEYQTISPRYQENPYSKYDWTESREMSRKDPNFKEDKYGKPNLLDYMEDGKPITFFEYMAPEDTPFNEGDNLRSTFLRHYKILPFEDAVTMRAHYQILKGMNSFYQKNSSNLKVGCGLASGYVFGELPSDGEECDEDPPVNENPSSSIDREIPFDEYVPSFSNEVMPSAKYSYCLILPNGDYKFTNSFDVEDISGLFIYLPMFDLWQYLSVDQLHVLMYMQDIKIQYSKVVDPNTMSDILMSEEFYASSLIDILETAVAVGADIGMRKKFKYLDYQKTIRPKDGAELVMSTPMAVPNVMHDALTFTINMIASWRIYTTLTEEDLGILPRSDSQRYNWKYPARTDIRMNTNITTRSRNNFWMLGIILQLANLRPDWGWNQWGM